jgi:hypothetical protein
MKISCIQMTDNDVLYQFKPVHCLPLLPLQRNLTGNSIRSPSSRIALLLCCARSLPPPLPSFLPQHLPMSSPTIKLLDDTAPTVRRTVPGSLSLLCRVVGAR